MSVNKIDFTLGSYNPNQAAGLIAMARENDRQISDSLKGILDGFEKTARENADVQAMNYINSLDLADLTPDKMAGHTQALQDISDGMGGLNPSKEALTALDSRGNVVAQRANNLANLEAQNILNQTNQINLNNIQDAHVLDTAVKTALSKPDSVEVIKSNLPTHLQGIFNHEFELYKLNQQNNYGDALNKVNAVRDSIENYKAGAIIDKLRTVLPNFQDANGAVDYNKLFADKNVLTLLGEDIHNPSILGKVLNGFDAKEAEAAKVAFDRMMAQRKAAVAEGHLGVAQQEVANKQVRFLTEKQEQENRQRAAQAAKTNEDFQKTIHGTALYGSATKNNDGSIDINPDRFGANVSNMIANASKPVEVKYKAPTVDAWWQENPDFGISNMMGFRQEGVRNNVRTEFERFKVDGKPVSKDTSIAMLEKLKSTTSNRSSFVYTSLQDRWGGTPYYKDGKIDMDALYADVLRDRQAEADNRVRAVSYKIMSDASGLGIDLGILNGKLSPDFMNKYGIYLDPDFASRIIFSGHIGNPQGKYINNVLDYGKKPVGTNTVLR